MLRYIYTTPLFYRGQSYVWLKGIYDCSSTRWYPSDTSPLTFKIISGSQYASFHSYDASTGSDVKLGWSVLMDTLNATEQYNFCLESDGVRPDSSGDWVVIGATNDGMTAVDSVLVLPYVYPVLVKIEPSEISPGDTANIVLEQVNSDGTLSDFPSDQQFEVGVTEGDSAGAILSSDGFDVGDYFYGVSEGFKLLAADSIQGDSAVVGVKVATINSGGGTPTSAAPANPVRKTAGTPKVATPNDFMSSDYGIGYVTIKSGHSILLGQTKYYYAIDDPNNSGKLIIESSTSPANGRTDATFTPPETVSGDKLGVYWEKMDSTGTPLQFGLIRLVGRYWQIDSTYEVTLTATTSTASGSINIEVTRPSKLGKTFNSVEDVFGHNINLDNLIIKYAGENGIPPQLIKGQMEVESTFRPKWRYEPFLDANTPKSSAIYQNNKFVMTADAMGAGFPPPGHSETAVAPTFYIKEKIKISKYITTYWSSRMVQEGKKANAPNIILGSEGRPYYLSRRWKERWETLKGKVSDPREAADNYIKGIVTDTTKFPGSAFDRLAETRIFTSYGFEQLLYTMTITDGRFYKETDGRYAPTGTQYMDKSDPSDYPEKLNEENFFMPRYCDRMLRNLNWLFPHRIPDSQWIGKLVEKNGKGQIIRTYHFEGFESDWKGSLYHYNWGSAYANKVWNEAQNFLPNP